MSPGDSTAEVSTATTMRRRAGESRLKHWVLLDANRIVVLAILSLAVFVAFVSVSVAVRPTLQAPIVSTNTIGTIFSTMIMVVVTGSTLVVTINQIILSQENGPLGDQRARMSGAMDFRRFTRELLGTAAPAEPSTLLRQLVEAADDRGEQLSRAVADTDDRELYDQIADLAESLRNDAGNVTSQLDDAEFGTFDVLSAALNFDYSSKLYQTQRMLDEFDASLDEDHRTALEELETALAMFGAAREHVKTLYFQWALIELSQYILYAAVPALVGAGCMLAFVGAETFPGVTLGVSDVTWVVSGAFTFTAAPFLLFTSYVLRIATVAKRTLAIGPLVLRATER